MKEWVNMRLKPVVGYVQACHTQVWASMPNVSLGHMRVAVRLEIVQKIKGQFTFKTPKFLFLS